MRNKISDRDQVFYEDKDHRSWHDQQAEMMAEQEIMDRAVVVRVGRGEATHSDAVYLAGRLNVKM